MNFHFPMRGSRGHRILLALLDAPATVSEGTTIHGEFPDRHGRITPYSRMRALYDNLVDRGCLTEEGNVYRVTMAAQARLETLAGREIPRLGVKATPPKRNIWSAPLTGYTAALRERIQSR